MNKLVQEAPQSYRGRMYRPDNTHRKEQRILVLKTGVAGLQFNIENDEERYELYSVTPGTELLLYRDPDNTHDPWAIEVYLTEDDKLGYITRYKNETIARLMDAGKKFIAVVDEIDFSDPSEEFQKQKASHAPTENLSLPFSVYMIEDA